MGVLGCDGNNKAYGYQDSDFEFRIQISSFIDFRDSQKDRKCIMFDTRRRIGDFIIFSHVSMFNIMFTVCENMVCSLLILWSHGVRGASSVKEIPKKTNVTGGSGFQW